MKIRKLELHGFKTFCDRTGLLLDQPITGVVGPNGCGKSNIVDAIRWCMGEQSSKTLRGDSMESVIFWGSQSRGPLGMSEVALTFENNGDLPPEYSSYPEIVVSRRLYRDGSSEYLLNKTPVRLRDVVDLFFGTGVGKAAYSIIEQGRIGQIVSARPEDLRTIIEEAAGVTKYRFKKKAAERRIEATRQNLARVADILAEIDRQVGSLRRQAEKAKRYTAYRAELKDLELWAATFRLLELRANSGACHASHTQAVAERDASRSTVASTEARLDATRLRHTQAQQQFVALQSEHASQQTQAKLAEQWVAEKRREAASLDERAASAVGQEAEAAAQAEQAALEVGRMEALHVDLEAQLETRREDASQAEAEAEERKERLTLFREQLRVGREGIARLDAEIARTESTVASLIARQADLAPRSAKLEDTWKRGRERQNEIAAQVAAHERVLAGLQENQTSTSDKQATQRHKRGQLEDDVRMGDARIDTLRQELHRLRSQLSTLRDIEETHEGLRRGVRAVLRWSEGEPRSSGRVRGILADIMETPPEYEAALEAALGDRLESVIVDRPETGFAAIEFLKRESEGRSTFVPMQLRHSAVSAPPTGEGVRGPMLGLVQVKEEYQHVAQHLLSDVVVVDDLPRASALWGQNGATRRFVTMGGEMVEPSGVISGGSREEAAGVLGRKRRIRELEELCASLDASLPQEIDKHVAVRSELVAVEHELAALEKAVQAGEIGLVSVEKDLERLGLERVSLDRQLDALTSELRSIAEAARGVEDELASAKVALTDLRERKSESTWRVDTLEAGLRDLAPHADAAVARASDMRVALAEARAQHSAASERLEMLRAQQDERARRAEMLARAARADRERAEQLRREAVTVEGELGPMVERLAALVDQVRDAEAHYQALSQQQTELEGILRTQRAAFEQAQEQTAGLEMQVRELEIETRHLTEQIRDRYRLELAEVAGDYHMRALPGDEEAQRGEELRRLIERMGEVNVAAIHELGEMTERREREAAQKADLEKAVADLEEAIAKTNRTCRKLFKEAFDAVNERLGGVFGRLFRGGRAELVLVGDGERDEQGVEIIAQPPGKKLESIRALSGGEKALTAVSLLFAIFLYRPSPFCLLDEVDAPLDEANVGRFCEMLREMAPTTQFILITHNQRTMEIADVLYGVTAEEPGVSKIVSVNLRKSARAA